MRAVIVVMALVLAGAARAEVVDVQPTGFEVRHVVAFDAPAAKVWAALSQISAWWDSGHTWSGDARNLSIELKAGGYWREALPKSGGAVQHMQVVEVDPETTVRLEGGLGPLMLSGASGHMSWVLAGNDAHATLTWTYDVGGYAKGGLDKLAAPVDAVLGAQANRLKHYVETGKPD